jgi:hypothetical protein
MLQDLDAFDLIHVGHDLPDRLLEVADRTANGAGIRMGDLAFRISSRTSVFVFQRNGFSTVDVFSANKEKSFSNPFNVCGCVVRVARAPTT